MILFILTPPRNTTNTRKKKHRTIAENYDKNIKTKFFETPTTTTKTATQIVFSLHRMLATRRRRHDIALLCCCTSNFNVINGIHSPKAITMIMIAPKKRMIRAFFLSLSHHIFSYMSKNITSKSMMRTNFLYTHTSCVCVCSTRTTTTMTSNKNGFVNIT